MAKGREWTTTEMKILREIWESDLTLKAQLHLLPGRSYIAVKQAVCNAGFGRKRHGFVSWVGPAALRILEETEGLTATELSRKIGCSYRGVINAMRIYHAEKKVHISEWRWASSIRVEGWAAGKGEDAPKPSRLPREVSLSRERLHKRVKYGKQNPFATASGLVSAPTTTVSSSYRHTLGTRDEELEAA